MAFKRKYDPPFTWEEANKLYPQALVHFRAFLSPHPLDMDQWIFKWSFPSLNSTEIDGLSAFEKKDADDYRAYLYFKGAWKTL